MTAQERTAGIQPSGSSELELDLKRYEVRHQGRRLRLGRQPMELLIFLAARPGELVTREEIAVKLWGDGFHLDTESGINNVIRKLRLKLGDDAEHPRILETVVGKGYRLIGPVKIIGRNDDSPATMKDGPVATAEGAPSTEQDPVLSVTLPAEEGARDASSRPRKHTATRAWVIGSIAIVLAATLTFAVSRVRRWLTADRPQIHSLAVLPLENLSGDPSQEYFADGMTDALITDLAKLNSLRVISRTSVMQYKGTHKLLPEIGRELHVDAVVEGSVARSGQSVRITAQLVYVADDRHLWAESYQRDFHDILQLQDQVAFAIAEQVRGKLGPQEQRRIAAVDAVEPEAYEAYLKGRYVWGKRTEPDLRKALEYFQEAISKDPGYARAYAGLALTHVVLGSGTVEAVAPADAFPRARAAAKKAIQLDESMAEAHASLAGIEHLYDWDWLGAGAEYRRAIELSPSYASAHQWYGQYLCHLSRFDEGIAETVRAHNLDPLNLMAGADVGLRLYWAGRYDEAVGPIQNTLKLDPNFAPAHRTLGQVYEQQGKYQQAIAEFQTDSALTHGSPISLAALAHAYGVSGDKKRALSLLAQLKKLSKERYVSGYTIALVYTGLGRKDDALEALEQAYRERSTSMVNLNVDPRLNPLRSDRRFQDLVRRVGLPSSPSANLYGRP